MKRSIQTLLAGASLVCASLAFADPVTPAYGSFGDLSGATFGGSGIPTDPTAITTIVDGDNTLTLGLTAHARYSNPALTNDGAGTFFAGTGANDGFGGPGTAALWNFAFYVDVAGGGSLADYSFKLYYDFDAGAGTDQSQMGVWDLTNTAALLGYRTQYQDSENATFGFLAANAAGFIEIPAVGTFDPQAVGDYNFKLTAAPVDNAAAVSGFSAITVNVNNVPDGGSTIALLGLALAGVGFIARRRA